MSPILPALLLMTMTCSTAVPQQERGADTKRESAMAGTTLLVHEAKVELGTQPVVVRLVPGAATTAIRDVARDPARALVLRVEQISVDRSPNVIYEVLVGGASVGVLSFYGADESAGEFVAAFPADDAAEKALARDGGALAITFRPRGASDEAGRDLPVTVEGHPRFGRLRLVVE